MALFDDQEIDIACPRCSRQTPKTVRWIKAHEEFVCPGCGEIVPVESARFLGGLGEVAASVERVRQRLRSRSRRR